MVCGDYGKADATTVPFQALLALGQTVHTVWPHKQAGKQSTTAIHDVAAAQSHREKPGHNFTLNARFAEPHPRSTACW